MRSLETTGQDRRFPLAPEGGRSNTPAGMRRMKEQVRQFASSPRVQHVLLAIGLLLVAVGSKWQQLHSWGSDVPYWDQWRSDVDVIVAWKSDNFDLSHVMTEPHNEHRLGWTRLWTLAHTLWNRQWDPLLICTTNALVHAGIGVFLLWQLCPALHGVARILVPVVLAGVLASPIAWENTLNSFQVQYYFLLGSAVVMLAYLPFHGIRSWRWWVGVGAGLFGLFTMASSFIAPAMVAGVRVLRAWSAQRWTRDDVLTLGVALLLTGVGYAMVNPVSGHASLHAQNVFEFARALARIGAFPLPNHPLLCLMLQLPLGYWLARRVWGLVHGSRCSQGEWFVLGLAGWLALQAAAIGYSRANFFEAMASRYLDLHALLLVANASALGLLWLEHRRGGRRFIHATTAVWLVISGYGLVRHSYALGETFLSSLPEIWPSRAASVRALVVDGDERPLLTAEESEQVYPVPEPVIAAVNNPHLRQLLPASIRKPVSFVPEGTNGFVPEPPANLPKLEHMGAVWSTPGYEQATWRSELIAADQLLPVLRITFAGAPSLPSQSIRLVDERGRVAPLGNVGFAGDRWQSAHLFVPRRARFVRLEVATPGEGNWVAFTSPVEVGLGSWLARSARKSGGSLFGLGGGLFAVGICSVLLDRRLIARVTDSEPTTTAHAC